MQLPDCNVMRSLFRAQGSPKKFHSQFLKIKLFEQFITIKNGFEQNNDKISALEKVINSISFTK